MERSPVETRADHLRYLQEQDRKVTLPLRIGAVGVWVTLLSLAPTPWWESALLTVVVAVAVLSLPVHTLVTFRLSRRENARRIYLAFTYLDTTTLALLIAATGGIGSPWVFSVPLQQVRYLKGTLGVQRHLLGGLIVSLAWLVPTFYIEGETVRQPISIAVAGSLLVIIYISAYQLLQYLNTLYRRQERFASRLERANEALSETYSARLKEGYEQTLRALARAVALKDFDTEDHSRRVVDYSLLIAEKMEIDESLLEPLCWGALLHDFGKIGIPDGVLLKRGPLSDREWKLMKRHPQLGYDHIRDIRFLSRAADVVLHHHERWDGKGYPRGLKGEEIPLLARIFAIADAFDAMTSDRPYRSGVDIEQARREIASGSGSQFCPRCVQAFLRIPVSRLKEVHRSRASVGVVV